MSLVKHLAAAVVLACTIAGADARTVLTSPGVLYADPTKPAGNDCATLATACRTIGEATAKLCNAYDLAGQGASIQLVIPSGQTKVTFTESVNVCPYLGGAVYDPTLQAPVIRGDPAHPENYTIDGGTGAAIFGGAQPLPWTIDGVTLAGAYGLEADNTVLFYIRNIRFTNTQAFIYSILHGQVVVSGDLEFVSSPNWWFWAAYIGGIAIQPGKHIKINSGVGAVAHLIRANDLGYIEIPPDVVWNGTPAQLPGSAPAYADFGGIIQGFGGLFGVGKPIPWGAPITAHNGLVN